MNTELAHAQKQRQHSSEKWRRKERCNEIAEQEEVKTQVDDEYYTIKQKGKSTTAEFVCLCVRVYVRSVRLFIFLEIETHFTNAGVKKNPYLTNDFPFF